MLFKDKKMQFLTFLKEKMPFLTILRETKQFLTFLKKKIQVLNRELKIFKAASSKESLIES